MLLAGKSGSADLRLLQRERSLIHTHENVCEFYIAAANTGANAVEYAIAEHVKRACWGKALRVVSKNDPMDINEARRAARYYGTVDGVDVWAVDIIQYGIEEPRPLMEVKRKFDLDKDANRGYFSNFQMQCPLIVQVDPNTCIGRLWLIKTYLDDELAEVYDDIVNYFKHKCY